MFYITLIPVLVLSIFTIHYLKEETKHDKVLYSLCEIRRGIINILREENFNFSKEEYFSIREFLGAVNNSVHYYNRAKLILFNFRLFLNFLKMYNDEIGKSEKIKLSNNPEIREFYKKFASTLIVGFFTYTPFIRSEILFRLVIYTGRHLAKYSKQRVNNYIDILSNIREQSKELGITPKSLQPI